MSAWDQIVATRRQVWKLAWLCYGFALAALVISIWHPSIHNAPVVFSLLGSNAMTAAILLNKIADLQAALDMKSLMRRGSLEP